MFRVPPGARFVVAGFIVALAVGVGACGDDGGGDGSAASGTSVSGVSTDVEGVVTTVEDVVSSTNGDVEVTVEETSPSTSADERGDDPVVPEGFTAVTITVTRADGTTEEWCVWLAENPRQHQRGLMEVTDLDGAAGMLFVYEDEVDHNFWMVNTPMPLSIAFFDADGGFISSTDMEPCLDTDTSRCDRYSASDSYQYALEVPQGELAALGIGEGSTVTLRRETATDACRPV